MQTAPSEEAHDKMPHPTLGRIVMTILSAFDLPVEIKNSDYDLDPH